ncbi:MAG: response regulator [Nitrospinaceae bacterium]
MAKILIVEDHDKTRLTLYRRLERAGHEVVSVPTGFEGIELLREGNFELVLLDFMMKGLNGMYTFEQMKVIRPDLPYVMMTAYAHSGLVKEFMHEGGVDFIVKPFGEDFEERIERDLDQFYGTVA